VERRKNNRRIIGNHTILLYRSYKIVIMKHTYVLFSFFMVFFYTYSLAQCGQGIPLYFDTQQEIDDFSMTHPGLTETNGNVIIKESIPGDITSLAGLSQLQKIDGCLYIRSKQPLGFNRLGIPLPCIGTPRNYRESQFSAS